MPPDDEFLTLWLEKRSERGEDAAPIARATGGRSGAVAAFDGLGGSGGAIVRTEYGEQSQARIAASVVNYAVDTFVDEIGPAVHDGPDAVPVLADHLCANLAGAVRDLGLGGGRLRSRLIRTLPTTLALARYERIGGDIRVEVIWAGDSRVYLVTPTDGAQLLSEDDLRSGGDALANLTDDSPMSNLVSASVPFVLNRRLVVVPHDVPALLLAATDGCFGYLPTPWHFEDLILSSLRSASSFADWGRRMCRRIAAVAGDDSSMGLVALGGGSHQALSDDFAERAAAVRTIADRYDEQARKLDGLRRRLGEAEQGLSRLRAAQWQEYRTTFEQWLHAVPKESGRKYEVSGRPSPPEPESPPPGAKDEPATASDHAAAAGGEDPRTSEPSDESPCPPRDDTAPVEP